MRREFKSLNKLRYKIYVGVIVASITSNPKAFFNFVNTKKKNSKMPMLMKFGDKETSNQREIADLFADVFKSVYEPASSGCLSEAPANTRLDINCLKFTTIDVLT